MTITLSKPIRQLAAVALLLAAVGIVFAATVLPLASYVGALHAGIGEQRTLLGRFQSFAAGKDRMEAMARDSDAALSAGLFLAGDTDAVRAANLQAHLTRVAQTQGVRLRSARALPATDRDGLRFISLQVEMDTGLRQLQAIILAFESMHPHLFIQSLQIAPLDTRGAGGDELKVRIGVAGAVPGGKG